MRRIAINEIGEISRRCARAGVLAVGVLSLPTLAQETIPQASAPETKLARQVIVSIPDRKLALVEGGRTLKLYSVAVGAPESPSPAGEFKVITRIENPTFYKPGTVIEPGPDNPLGTRWIGLNRKSYGIHGTNMPLSIGKAASHGCIRMYQRDLEELFTLLQPGDVVAIRAERDEEVAKAMTVEPVLTTDSGVTFVAGDAQN